MPRIYRTSVLEQMLTTRKEFDPENPHHLDELRYFVEHGKWKFTCPFIVEEPYDDIPVSCLAKYAKHCLTQKK
jgi:hypothetical protein